MQEWDNSLVGIGSTSNIELTISNTVRLGMTINSKEKSRQTAENDMQGIGYTVQNHCKFTVTSPYVHPRGFPMSHFKFQHFKFQNVSFNS